MKWWEDTIWIAIENPLKQDHENPSTENTVGGGCGKPQCSKFLTEKNNPKTCCSLTQTFQLNFRQLQHFKYWHHYRQTHCATNMKKGPISNKAVKIKMFRILLLVFYLPFFSSIMFFPWAFFPFSSTMWSLSFDTIDPGSFGTYAIKSSLHLP